MHNTMKNIKGKKGKIFSESTKSLRGFIFLRAFSTSEISCYGEKRSVPRFLNREHQVFFKQY